MTQQEFDLIAEAIADTRDEFKFVSMSSKEVLDSFTSRLADRLEARNPNFNWDKFFDASYKVIA